MLFEMAVDEELDLHGNPTPRERRVALQRLKRAGHPNGRRSLSIHHVRLCGAERVDVGGAAAGTRQLPARRVWVDVVPDCSEIQIAQRGRAATKSAAKICARRKHFPG